MMNWIAIQEKYKSQSLQAKRDLNITKFPPFFGCPTVMSFYKLKSCLLHFIGQLIQVQDASRLKKRKKKKEAACDIQHGLWEQPQHAQSRAVRTGDVRDASHLVERSEPGVQLIHSKRNTVEFGRWI